MSKTCIYKLIVNLINKCWFSRWNPVWYALLKPVTKLVRLFLSYIEKGLFLHLRVINMTWETCSNNWSNHNISFSVYTMTPVYVRSVKSALIHAQNWNSAIVMEKRQKLTCVGVFSLRTILRMARKWPPVRAALSSSESSTTRSGIQNLAIWLCCPSMFPIWSDAVCSYFQEAFTCGELVEAPPFAPERKLELLQSWNLLFPSGCLGREVCLQTLIFDTSQGDKLTDEFVNMFQKMFYSLICKFLILFNKINSFITLRLGIFTEFNFVSQ